MVDPKQFQSREVEIYSQGADEFKALLIKWLDDNNVNALDLLLNNLPDLYWAYESILWRAFERIKPNYIPLGIPLEYSINENFAVLLETLNNALKHPCPRINSRGVWEQGFMTCLLKEYLPNDGYSFLDIGCGKGFLPSICSRFYPKAKYTGLDILESEIGFCKYEFRANKRFEFIQLYSGHSVYKSGYDEVNNDFPIANNEIDVVFGLSIWTHLSPNIAMHYLKESLRVLKKGGIFLATFYIYNNEAGHQSQSSYNFNTPFQEINQFYYQTSTNPIITQRRDPVAVSKEYLMNVLKDLGLKVLRFIPGCWNTEDGYTGAFPQDCIVAIKI